ncbi:MAG: NTP transferase domain-containing protein [Actinomycetales bacterium]|nr:NTP transferase domain-containing protein [Actinomycetales bacterium]
MSGPPRHGAALLLTGGSSRRIGRDKSQLIVEGTTLARRTASLLERVVATAIEVGPGTSGLASVLESPRGAGPLVAIAAGYAALCDNGDVENALVVACDLPLLSEDLLRLLLNYDVLGSVVPVVEGRAQPLCARWSRRDLERASELATSGERSVRHVTTQSDVTLLDDSHWGHVATPATFFDVDDPADVNRLGLSF